MIRLIAIEMLNSNLEDPIAILGFESEKVKNVLCDLPIRLLFNPVWDTGQSSSINTLVKALDSSTNDLLIMLGDLPGIKVEHINRLIKSHQSQPSPETQITLPKYRGKRGNPVIWGGKFFPELQTLTGDIGGRALFSKHCNSINFVDFMSDIITTDINTRSALKTWIHNNC